MHVTDAANDVPTVALVYDRDCQNVDRARAMIAAALREVGAPPVWTEWDREGQNTPEALRSYGSPTVLVNGQDVGCDEDDEVQADANACRVYRDESGCLCGAPSARLIVSAMHGARTS
jgi:hypothetical protein